MVKSTIPMKVKGKSMMKARECHCSCVNCFSSLDLTGLVKLRLAFI